MHPGMPVAIIPPQRSAIIAERPSFRGEEVGLIGIDLSRSFARFHWRVRNDGLDGRTFEQGLEILPGRGSRFLHDLLRWAFSNDLAAIYPAARAQIQHPVGGLDDV